MQSTSRFTVGTAALLISLALTSPVSAQPATNGSVPAPHIETVIVKSPKNAAMMPYDDVYERLKRMQESKLDRIRLQIKILPTRDDLKLTDVRVAIVNDNASVNLPLGADGLIELPVRSDLYKTDAEIRSNQPKGSLSATINLAVSWDGGKEIAYAEIEETVRQLQRGGKDLMGWFAYLVFFPSFESLEVPVQFPKANGQTLKVMKDGRVVEIYSADDKGLLKFRLKREWGELQPTLVFSEAPPKG